MKNIRHQIQLAQDRLNLPSREIQSLTFGTIEECKELIRECFLFYDSTISEDSFQWLKEYDEVAEWMNNTQGKGLLLTGTCGTGKTLILKYVIPIAFKIKYNKILKPFFAKEAIKEEVAKELLNSKKKVIAIDEIGSETFLNNFGQRIDIIHDVILSSEELNRTLILTTNFNSQGLKERYDARAVDRLRKMCKAVVFTEQSMRK